MAVTALMRGAFEIVGVNHTLTISVKAGSLEALVQDKPPPCRYANGCYASRRNPAIGWLESLADPYGISCSTRDLTVDLLSARLIFIEGFALSSYGERTKKPKSWCFDAYTANSLVRMSSVGVASHNTQSVWATLLATPTSADLAYLSLPQLNDAEFFQLSPENVHEAFGSSGDRVGLTPGAPPTWAEARRQVLGVLAMLGDHLTNPTVDTVLRSFRPSTFKGVTEFTSDQGNVANLSLEADMRKCATWTVSTMLQWETDRNTGNLPMKIIRGISYLDEHAGEYTCDHTGWAAVRQAMYKGSHSSSVGLWFHLNGNTIVSISGDCEAALELTSWSFNIKPTFNVLRTDHSNRKRKFTPK